YHTKSNAIPRLSEGISKLLKEACPEAITSTLSESQERVLELVRKGNNVLILGSAGCGKSTVIKEIKSEFKNKKVYITSTTGISAYNIQGVTLHSFMGFGTGEGPLHTLLSRIRRRKGYTQRLIETEILIVDEISMMSAELFEKVDTILREIRRIQLPFGGIQMIFSGDLLQLKPVIKETEWNPDPDQRLIFESSRFSEYFETVVLTTNFRQQHDVIYQGLLTNIRRNTLTSGDLQLLTDCLGKKPPKGVPFLVPTNKAAGEINKRETLKLKTPKFTYTTVFQKEIHTSSHDETLSDMYLAELKNQFKQKDLDELVLRAGSRVMLTRNLDVSSGLVNGALGTISSACKGGVSVEFDNGSTKDLVKEKWELGTDDFTVTASQIPLILAYAITIHKSQSLTLENARIDLARCFADHMVYVALSRVKSLDGLYLESFDASKVMVDKKTLEYLDSIPE
ncbi:ATP-dependent DNA helicase PIF1-like protein, partial [Mimivirus AB-566-O17]